MLENKKILVAAGAAVLFVIYAALSAVVVPQGQEAALTGEVVFDPTSEATRFWNENADQYFSREAVELTRLVSEAGGDLESLAQKYGHFSMGDSGELSFIVKGSGTVTEVKNKLKAGYLALSVPGLPDGYNVRLQIGPVFKGSAIRDSISLISFKDYKNQIEWAQVSVAFHDLIVRDVLSQIDMNGVEGKNVSFTGAFTIARAGLLQIVPVELRVN